MLAPNYVCIPSTAEVSIQGGRKRKHLRAKKGRNIDYRSATARLRTSGKNLNPKDGFIFIFSLQSITLPDSKVNYGLFKNHLKIMQNSLHFEILDANHS